MNTPIAISQPGLYRVLGDGPEFMVLLLTETGIRFRGRGGELFKGPVIGDERVYVESVGVKEAVSFFARHRNEALVLFGESRIAELDALIKRLCTPPARYEPIDFGSDCFS